MSRSDYLQLPSISQSRHLVHGKFLIKVTNFFTILTPWNVTRAVQYRGINRMLPSLMSSSSHRDLSLETFICEDLRDEISSAQIGFNSILLIPGSNCESLLNNL
jgi:hypothetical protein